MSGSLPRKVVLVRLRLLFVLALLATFACGSPRAASALDTPYFAWNAGQSALVGHVANQPQAVRAGDFTFIAYQGPWLDPWVAAYDWRTRTWSGPYRAGTNAHTWDTHGAPAVSADASGYVHVFFGPHHQPLRHVRSAQPWRVDRWVELPTLGAKTTYPELTRTSATSTVLFYRSLNGTNELDWVMRESADGGSTFGPERELFDVDNGWAYYCTFREGPSGTIDVAWVRTDFVERYEQGTWSRYHVFFASRDASGTWFDAHGAPLSLPISMSTVWSRCLVANTGTEYANIPVPGRTPSGAPCVMWLQGDASSGPGSHRYRFARRDAGGWVTSEVAGADLFNDSLAFTTDEAGITAYVELRPDPADPGPPVDPGDGNGGRLHRLRTTDDGATWTDLGIFDPGPGGALLGDGRFHNAHLVAGGTAADRIVFTEWRSVPTLDAFGLYLWGDEGVATRTVTPRVRRISGSDRYSTAAEAAKQAYPQGAGRVIIASGDNPWDALVAAPLAASYRAPILLTAAGGLPQPTIDALAYLRTTDVVIIGGEKSVPYAIELALKKAGVKNVGRITGDSRYGVAANVAEQLRTREGTPEIAYVASGLSHADALAIGAVAARRLEPVLLTPAESLPPETGAELGVLAPGRVVVVGGTRSVSAGVYAAVGADERISGADRYDLATRIATWSLAHGGSPRRVLVANGDAFPDALSASVLCARYRGVTLVLPPGGTGPAVDSYLARRRNEVLEVIVCGGDRTVTPGAVTKLQGVLNPQ